MKFLKKYHKQTLTKETISALNDLNKKFKLNLKPNLRNYFRLMVIENAVKQKIIFEQGFETFRNEHHDMWDNLMFNDRNRLFQLDFHQEKEKLKKFEFHKETIYIAFFDVLMNNLYDRETAILELPQFYKLYENYQTQCIDIDTYGILPYLANMSHAHCIESKNETAVLYDDSLKTFYRLNDQIEYFPFGIDKAVSDADIETLGEYLIEFKDQEFLNHLYSKNLLNDRATKKYKKVKK